MKIVRPYAKIIKNADAGVGIFSPRVALERIEWAGRISHRSEDKQSTDSWRKFIETVVLGHGDWSIVEHVSVSVDFLVDRGITHEIVRHRLFSYTQESTRFVNYEKKMEPAFIYPKPEVECKHCLDGVVALGQDFDGFKKIWLHYDESVNHKWPCAYDPNWLQPVAECEQSYKELLKKGWRPQEARSVFPNALASRLIMTGNLRSWRHFFTMRTTLEAHPQMRQVTIPLLQEFKDAFPLLFDDITPNMKQSESMRRPR